MGTRSFEQDHRRRFVMQALLVLAIITFVGGSTAFFYLASLPYVGFEFSGESVVGAVDPGGPAAAAGLMVGDRILTIDGLAPMSSGEIYLPHDADRLQLQVAREGQTLALEMDPAPPSLASVADKAGYFSMALGFWIVAVLVLVFKPKDSVAQFFILLVLLSTATIVTWRVADLGALWANVAMGVLTAIIGSMFVHYHTLFPERSDFRGKDTLLRWLYGVGIALAIGSLLLDVLYYTGLYRQIGSDPWPSAAVTIKVYFAFCLFVGLVLLWRTKRVTRSERSKRQIALLVMGSGVALLPLITLILVPQILFAHYLVPSWIPLLMLAFLPASYIYATYRHDLMKLDGIVNRSVVLCFIVLALVLLYLGLEWGIRSVLPGSRTWPVVLGDVIPILALLVAFQPLKQKIERLVDGFFYGGWYNYESLTLEMSQALNEAVDLETIVVLLTETAAPTMRVKEVALLLPDGKGNLYTRASRGFDPPLFAHLSAVLVSSLQECGKPIGHALLGKQVPSDAGVREEIAAYTQAGVQVWVPLVQQGQLEAILVLGSKLADEFYTQNDHTILLTLAQQAAITLARTRLVDELKGRLEEVKALSTQLLALQERNQQRMALELHDQVVQDVLFVRRLLDSVLKETPSKKIEGARDELLRIAGYLDTLIFELRPPELERGELGQILHKYAANFELWRNLPVSFHVNGGSDGAAIPKQIKLAVYRIFQESLNNARKHADANQVDASLDVRPAYVRLEVHDDGAGFEVPAHLGGWITANRLGLLGMRTRAEELGGNLDVVSQPGQGTHILVEIPLPA